MARGDGGFCGGHPRIFELKGGGIPKIEGEGGHAGICTGLRGHSKGKLARGHAKFFRDLKKPPIPNP